MSHFKIVFEKSKYYLEADEVVDAPDAGMYEDVDKQDSYTNYYGFSKSEVKNDKLNYLKQIFSCTRFRRSDLRMYSKMGLYIHTYLAKIQVRTFIAMKIIIKIVMLKLVM